MTVPSFHVCTQYIDNIKIQLETKESNDSVWCFYFYLHVSPGVFDGSSFCN